MEETLDTTTTQKIVPAKQIPYLQPGVGVRPRQAPQKPDTRRGIRPIPKRDRANSHALYERCRQVCLSAFFREHAPVRSLGFTSSVGGEGKSFLSIMTAQVLADDSTNPVILLECNWENPNLHKYFGFAPTPGLAEWLRGECSKEIIYHKIGRNLTIIPAGNGRQDAVKLVQQIRQTGLLDMFACSNELLVVDLPTVVTTAYGAFAASLVESLLIVVCAGATPEALIAETSALLKDLPVQGVVLNQIESSIPRWIRRML